MREVVIERDGVLHYALKAMQGRNVWYVFCDAVNFKRRMYRNDDLETALPTCVRCLGEEALRGKPLERIEVD